jgi:hypothetical protein
MAWFLFIDESGQDHRDSPYEVLAGIAIHDASLWKLIRELQDAEISRFGRRYSLGIREVKGKKILKAKVFHHAELNMPIFPNEIPELAKECLDNGVTNSSVKHLKALALAKIAYVSDAFILCQNHGCKVFASIVEPSAPLSESGGLRKDYAYLFERFFYFLEDHATESGLSEHGILVFDELEKSKSHILIDQASQYFSQTATGRQRASLAAPVSWALEATEKSRRTPPPTNRLNSARGSHHTLSDRPRSTASRISRSLRKLRRIRLNQAGQPISGRALSWTHHRQLTRRVSN